MTPHGQGARRALAVVAVVCGVAALLATALIARVGHTSHPARSAPVVDLGTLPGGSRDGSGHDSATGATAGGSGTVRRPDAGRATGSGTSATGRPVPVGSRLILRRLGVDARVVQVQVRDGVMDVPENPRTVGWWSGGAGTGAAAGSTVLVGHINFHGVDGALSVLPDTRPGDTVIIAEPAVTLRYRIAAVRTYAKDRGIPASAFATTGAPRLVLITCGGPFDAATGNYEDNIVVYAVPADT